MDTETRASILAEAFTWLGTPYHHKGRIKGVGVDCGGFLYEVYKNVVPDLPPFPHDYPQDWALHRSEELYLNYIERFVVPISKPVLAGVALFKYGRTFSHAAICTKNGYIHAYGRTGFGAVIHSRLGRFEGRPVRYFDLK